MTNLINLSNPPIQEALLGVKLEMSARLTVEILDEIFEELIEDFPQKSFQNAVEFTFGADTENTIEQKSVEGVILTSSDGKRVLRINNDGFVFSFVNHYSNWDEFIGEGLSFLSKVIDKLRPLSISAISTRFINRISIDESTESYDDIFAVRLKSEDDTSWHPDEYLIQYLYKSGDIISNVIQTVDSNSLRIGIHVAILDIDASLKIDEPDVAMVTDTQYVRWKELRDAKNEIFSRSIKQAAMERFN